MTMKRNSKNPIHDKTVAIRDTYRRQQEHKSSQASIVQYTVGEQVQHPKFGEGCIEKNRAGDRICDPAYSIWK
mgnify:CR=1 FL=1